MARKKNGSPVAGTTRAAKLSSLVDPVALVGIVISIALSIILEVSKVANTAEAILVGLAGMTISLTLDSVARAERRFELRGLIEAAPWLRPTFVSLSKETKEVLEIYPDGPVAQEVLHRYERLRNEIGELHQGRIYRPRGDDEYLMVPMQQCERELIAVTNIQSTTVVPAIMDWWHTGIGPQYWAENVRAMQERSVRISRVFIYAEMTPELEEVIATQRAHGARVGAVPRSALDPYCHVNFALWDDRRAWEAQMNAHGEIIRTVFTLNRLDIARLRSIFRTCEQAAQFR
ncbi:hypothetical protein [Longispora albida]|uniref:hypothetical protein n=1 Tax=Longispora albida TaxID=203523 RepID=UPI000376F3B7|nr:hypothetical protein [Longispora albida]